MHYRKDIQILRGIAVLLVVLFHLQIVGMKSGFLGVDVFFVISGFLMAILYDPSDKRKFFLRRAKRLLPVYFVVVLLTLIASIWITIPNEYNQVVTQSIYATFFSSNIGSWMQNSYFSKADFNPLLHLWSLGVEIQFYLVVPLLAWLFRKTKFLFLLILFMSLLLCFTLLYLSPKTSFFMMPLRVWEFLIGYGIAMYFTNNGNIKYTSFRVLGLMSLIILLAIPFFGITGQAMNVMYGHPGVLALTVSLATGVVLIFSIPHWLESSKVGTVLEIVGKYSYSIYLVHFPVMILFLYQPFSGTLLKADSMMQTGALLLFICSLSFLMYRYIENPSRHSKNIIRSLSMAIPLIFLVIVAGKKIQEQHYSLIEKKIFYAWDDRSPYRCGKLIRVLDPSAMSCNLTEEINKPRKSILLVGNSHADAIKSTFSKVAKAFNVSVRFVVSNIPLMKGSSLRPTEIVNDALKYKINTIVLHYSPNAINSETIERLVRLSRKNHIKVKFIMPVPVWKESIPKQVYNHLSQHSILPRQTKLDYQTKNEAFYKELLAIKDLDVYRVDDLLCQDECSFQDKEGNLYYFDDGHLTLSGASVLKDVFSEILEDVISLP